MTPIPFTKMHGAGNDYVYVDCFAQPVPKNIAGLARTISDRHRGVGADGLILICPSKHADAEMRMFNADGTSSEMCGNGIRCVAKYVHDHGIARNNRLKIASGGKTYRLELFTQNGLVERVRVDMGEPILSAHCIPTTLIGRSTPMGSMVPADAVINVPLTVAGATHDVTCVSMGNPHCILFVESATDALVHHAGPQIETDSHFPNRTNVEFVELLSPHEVRQRTWERGSGETWACGTGACAVCVAGVLTGHTQRRLTVHLQGGDLQLEWNDSDNHVSMTGPAVEVFSGQWRMP